MYKKSKKESIFLAFFRKLKKKPGIHCQILYETFPGKDGFFHGKYQAEGKAEKI